MGRSTEEETGLSEHRKYRKLTAKQKLEIVLASPANQRSACQLPNFRPYRKTFR
jgi:hypothetical protein